MLLGHTTSRDTTASAGTGTRLYALPITVPDAQRVAKIALLLDGNGALGSGRVRGLIYDATGKLVLSTEIASVTDTDQRAWVDLLLPPGQQGPILPAADYRLAVIVEGAVPRVYATAASSGLSATITGTLTDPDPTITTFTAAPQISAYLLTFDSFRQVGDIDVPSDVARYGFDTAQQQLARITSDGGASSSIAQVDIICRVGWHGDDLLDDTGSRCLVNPLGALGADDLAGHIVRIATEDGRSLHAYVEAMDETITEDLTLTREMYAQIKPLWDDEMSVPVRVL
jgi:hypothetical protein